MTLSLQDVFNEGVNYCIAFLNRELMAVLRIYDGTSVTAARSDLLSQLPGLIRTCSIILGTIQDQHAGLDLCG